MGVEDGTRWERPAQEKLREKLRKAKGSGGTDGWTACEVKMVPDKVADLFYRVTAT